MQKTGLVPLVASGLLYLVLGFIYSGAGKIDVSVFNLFANHFTLGFIPVIPAILVLVLSFMKVPARKNMTCSILVSLLIGYFLQHCSLENMLQAMVWGYIAKDPQLGRLLNGGGIISLYSVIYIVVISAAFAGIFKGTGLLLKLKDRLQELAQTITPFGVFTLAAIMSSMISGSQMVSSVITNQLCDRLEPNNQRMAINLENTSVVLAPLVPWGIGCIVPCTMVGLEPWQAVGCAFYLYLLPLWRLWVQSVKHSY